MAFSKILWYTLITLFLAVLLLIGIVFQGYDGILGSIFPTRKPSNKSEYDIAPWSASYEGKTIMERQDHRHRILNQVCNSTKHTKIEKLPSQILVNGQNKLVFCFIPKVGSATLLRTVLTANQLALELPRGEFNVHSLKQLERYGIKQLKTFSMEEQKDILRTHYKFLFVRHPIVRLRSAHRMFTDTVRRGPRTRKTNTPILKASAALLYDTDWKVKGFPQFDTFIHLISSKWNKTKSKQNPHWNNFQDLCLPCYIKYDFIGKHEYFSEELNYILQNRLPKAAPIVSKNIKTHWIALNQIYGNLSKDILDSFLQRYRSDFRLFNYRYEI